VPEVSVIVPARDAERSIEPLLAAVGAQLPRELIVVDNGSLDATAEIAERSPLVTKVVRRPRGAGPGAARNAGAAAAASDVLAFIDADCRPAPSWLAAGVTACTSAELVQGRVLPDPDVRPAPFDRTLSVGAAHGLFETANLFVQRALFERLGGFGAGLQDDDAAPFGEDVIFGWRAVRDGARTGFSAEALVYHEVVRRTPTEFIAERNRLRLFPLLAAQVPELREAFFYKRYFHSRRSAAFDLALLGIAGAVAARRPGPLAATLPYVALAARDAACWGRRALPVACVEALSDAVGALSLVRGSLQSGSPVL
jgi:glycosyltransferase involved in cell wall biosynthesis